MPIFRSFQSIIKSCLCRWVDNELNVWLNIEHLQCVVLRKSSMMALCLSASFRKLPYAGESQYIFVSLCKDTTKFNTNIDSGVNIVFLFRRAKFPIRSAASTILVLEDSKKQKRRRDKNKTSDSIRQMHSLSFVIKYNSECCFSASINCNEVIQSWEIQTPFYNSTPTLTMMPNALSRSG